MGEYLLYLRKSKGRAGISRQRDITTRHVARLGGSLIAPEFEDTDRTAYSAPGEALPVRPGFTDLIAALKARPGAGIAAWHADRIARTTDECEQLIHLAAERGGLIVETAQGGTYDLDTATGRHRLRGDIIAAQYEVDHMTERILAQKAEARAAGAWLGGPVAFGWRRAPAGGLELHPDEAPAVRAAYEAVITGTSLREIGRRWGAAGLRPARGGAWSHGQVRAILLRPTNIGLAADGSGPVVPAQWPGLIDEPAWRAARAILTDPQRQGGPGPRRRHLLSGIALCGGCGAPVVAVKAGGGNRGTTYRCRAQARQEPTFATRHSSRDAAKMDAYATVLAVGRLRRDDAASLLRPDHAGERAELLAREAALTGRRQEIWQLYRERVITAPELAEGNRDVTGEIAAVRGRLGALDEADALAPMIADPGAAWEKATLDQRRAVIQALMWITIMPASGPVFDPDSIDVRWRQALPSDSQASGTA